MTTSSLNKRPQQHARPKRHRLIAAAIASSSLAFALETTITGLSACDPTYTLIPSAQTEEFNATGQLQKIRVTTGSSGVQLTFASNPASITLSPPTVITGDDGSAEVTALVPYGTTGVVTATVANAGASAKSQPVGVPPLILCDPSVVAIPNSATSQGQLYQLSVRALVSGMCAINAGSPDAGLPDAGLPEVDVTAAPAGIPIAFSVIQTLNSTALTGSADASTSPQTQLASATAVTTQGGVATAILQLPWNTGTTIIQVSGGASTKTTTTSPQPNPISLNYGCWTDSGAPNIYQLTTSLNINHGSAAGALVTFNLLIPDAGTLFPATATANSGGLATTVFNKTSSLSENIPVELSSGTIIGVILVGEPSSECTLQ